MQLSFKSEIAALTEDLKKIKASAIPKATTQALNRTARGSKTDSVRELSKKTSLKQSDVRPQVQGPSDNRKLQATKDRQVARVDVRKGYSRNLINFVSPSLRKANHFNARKILKSGKKGKYKAKGVKAKAWGTSKVYKGSFIGRGQKGNLKGQGSLLVFARTSKSQYPIKALKGPSIRQEFERRPMQEKLRAMARFRFQKEMTAAVRNQIRLATQNRK